MTDPKKAPAMISREKAQVDLVLCEWNGSLHCVYLNDSRIAGEKPWGGGAVIKRWSVDVSDVFNALPTRQDDTEALVEALEKAQKIFLQYAELHAKKNTTDNGMKASRNMQLANEMADVLAKHRSKP